VNLNKGKQDKKIFTFLGKKFNIGFLPCGVNIPFNIEVKKLRQMSLDTVEKIDPKTKSSELFGVLNLYYIDHEEEAFEQLRQMVRAISVITEFYFPDITEKFILDNADEEDVADFFFALQTVQEEKAIKKISKRRLGQ